MKKKKNSSIIVAFDCDGTLIDDEFEPRAKIVDFYKLFESIGCTMMIWSGGGKDYAEKVANKLGLNPDIISDKYVLESSKHMPTITIDNDFELHYQGKVMLMV